MAQLPPPGGEGGDLLQRAEWMIARLEGDAPGQATALLQELRDARLYPPMVRLAEAIVRKRPDEHRARRLYAQALIEQGQACAAIDVLERLAARLKPDHPEHGEATGLLGRAHKQLFFDAKDKTTPGARASLQAAIRAYRRPYERHPASTWHGINLVALLARAAREGLPLPRGLKADAVARQVIAALDQVAPDRRDEWYHATRAEAALALGDWPVVREALHAYVATPAARAFMIQSTLRQFTQVWDLEHEPGSPGAELVGLLRARLLAVSEGAVQLSPQALAEARRQPTPDQPMLEAVLGEDGTQTWQWWKLGLDRAAAVCVVRSRTGVRMGTGWLARAADFGLPTGREPNDEQVLVTNFHVVNPEGSDNGLAPEQAEVVFEAVDPQRAFGVRRLVWCSSPDKHDAALLQLEAPVEGITPLPLARRLPLADGSGRVYVIGHPGGRGLSYSLQDNALLGHEGPPNGKPSIEGVCRVHYRAPTEGGSSGSPVFNRTDWQVIALHHMGGKEGMRALNGQPGTCAANEGIAIASIKDALAAEVPRPAG